MLVRALLVLLALAVANGFIHKASGRVDFGDDTDIFHGDSAPDHSLKQPARRTDMKMFSFLFGSGPKVFREDKPEAVPENGLQVDLTLSNGNQDLLKMLQEQDKKIAMQDIKISGLEKKLSKIANLQEDIPYYQEYTTSEYDDNGDNNESSRYRYEDYNSGFDPDIHHEYPDSSWYEDYEDNVYQESSTVTPSYSYEDISNMTELDFEIFNRDISKYKALESRVEELEKRSTERAELEKKMADLEAKISHDGGATKELTPIKVRLALVEGEAAELRQDQENHMNDLEARTKADVAELSSRIERQLKTLKTEIATGKNASLGISELERQTAMLEIKLNEVVKNVTARLERGISTLNTEVKAGNRALSSRLESLIGSRAAFATTEFLNPSPAIGETLLPEYVTHNQGGSFNRTSGRFTAAVNGTYFFAASFRGYFEPEDAGTYMSVTLVVADHANGKVRALTQQKQRQKEAASLHAVTHLHAGQSVWLRSDVDRVVFVSGSFAGFLVSPDL